LKTALWAYQTKVCLLKHFPLHLLLNIKDRVGQNLVRKLYEEKKVARNLFSLCFAPLGGTMSIGTLGNALQRTSEIQYAKVSTKNNG